MAIAPAREGRGGFASRPRQNRLSWKLRRIAPGNTSEAPGITAESFHSCMKIFVFKYFLVFNDRL